MRTAQLDADNRREPKTGHYCVRCHKDLKPGQPFRLVVVADWAFATVAHPDDLAGSGYDWNHDPGAHAVGMDCAKKIGLAFTVEPGDRRIEG